MLPQGSLLRGTGVPRWVLHTTAPVPALREYTESFSVTAMTRPRQTSGSAKTLPSSLLPHALDSLLSGGVEGLYPVRTASR